MSTTQLVSRSPAVPCAAHVATEPLSESLRAWRLPLGLTARSTPRVLLLLLLRRLKRLLQETWQLYAACRDTSGCCRPCMSTR